ncbi:PREDICTED: putative speedy protein-like protein [Colobus angolensis palliatus]|uniref:putative speedy protein-like protein n=1 Tax=Colobus angolensis palliatus TaxID=336983 RepID=UPI0005F44E39|nr:PREDICTED: putative speedy protein-like protein [Colobus angolensis palliatus]
MGQILGKNTTLLPKDKEESPQPNTSGYSLQQAVDDEVPGPSAPGVDASPSCRFLFWRRKRKWSDRSEERPEKELAPEPEKLKRWRVSSVLPEHHEAFNRLLEDPVIKRFLAWDKDLRVSDKYLLAMVIAYFSRAGLFSWQYQRIHFFLALYLANDMEEDCETSKQKIIDFLYSKTCSQTPWFLKHLFQFFPFMRQRARLKRSQKVLFHKLRFQFFRSMGFRAWVSLKEVEEIQAYDPEHWVWERERATFPSAPGAMEA